MTELSSFNIKAFCSNSEFNFKFIVEQTGFLHCSVSGWGGSKPESDLFGTNLQFKRSEILLGCKADNGLPAHPTPGRRKRDFLHLGIILFFTEYRRGRALTLD